MPKKKGPMPPGIPSFTVFEEDGEFVYYRPSATLPIARFDRERAVLTAARSIGKSLGASSTRVVFIIPTQPGN